ncbi:RSC complex subunit Rsc58 [Taphrina deformans PYCC 5710]|uniref:RSC complex subunit Rsc58 n=1 Tax=Taphrina deformans (strain PYCC 5710 / ATCC 11124 / CBS 356.35 / IMI 108563 / JCM 9778 / NBRC 8474) TaxID=1097556 RepID=R4XAJ1_TAPDE|nr:RSC complex subunit Rsc58 [Taphrina deformans PYCC 5710]|eukprot:CCG81307.1 RSC complex subunit Rsc58 [Taphrina deformans PYCC 5710]
MYYDSLVELSKHLTHAYQGLVPSVKSSKAREQIARSYRYITTLIQLASKETPDGPKSPTNDSVEGPQGFPDRPPEKKALFASTVTGPLFTSATNLRAEDNNLELPSHLQLIDVLPTPSTGSRALEDLRQDPVLSERNTYLAAGRQAITTARPIRRSQHESFGPDVDSTGAILGRDTTNMLLTHLRSTKLKPPAANDDVDLKSKSNDDKTHDIQPIDFSFDEDLLDTFDTQEVRDNDITTMLMELAESQSRRLAQSAFTSPSDEEQALAQTISRKLQETITNQGVKPAQLVSTGVRRDFSLMRYTPSYTGTLPPTIAQAVRATYAQVVPLKSQPFQTSRPQHFTKDVRTGQSNRASNQSTPHTQHSQLTKPVP